MLSVLFYRTDAGNEPVLEWLRGLDADDRRIIGEDLRTVQLGWPLGMPLCRALGGGLFEVRSSITDNRITRLIFFQHDAELIIVVGFIKKSQSIPDDVLKLSRKRKSEYERNAPKAKK